MAIQKEFVLRYRSEGHVRFQIPRRATQAQVAKLITDNILAIEGVYAVSLFRRSKKLVIRYHENVLSFIDMARQLHVALAALEQQGWFDPQAIVELSKKPRLGLKHKFKAGKIKRWFGEKVTAAKETAQAAKLLGKLSSKGPTALIKDPEKAIIGFLNDILVLYLIKVHWTRITQQWLVKPFVHRYEWLATFYLFFLLVRSRRPK
ncbi:hypothetical protein IVG45_20915 [Methylomonas sp. LL1]|uniref:hypothetical protein n=1 Tax=Methylomonas sp. LL1 TaxID=2785785 RepID=UPI0018C40A7F|nr:hypothetical protein [Methylomonas sp. LL1]QPK63236.1 hypothetical protein IVG45_20915 [Methylomonas sp. LL1]